MSQKSPQVVKHVVKGEKWACSTLEAGKNKPIMFFAKTRGFKRFCEKIKENRRFDWTSDFGLSDKTWTCGLYHPKGDLNIFLVILSFFRPFRYGKNDLSRSRDILSPGAPIVSMVVYVVVKIRSQIDGFGLMGADRFILNIYGQPMWSLSQLQLIKVVVLYLFFSRLSREFAIKICTAIIKEKARSNHLHHVCADALVHTWWRWSQLQKVTFPMLSKVKIWYAVSKEKAFVGVII